MPEYRRIIAYLYAYEHGEQARSTGFVKLEERKGSCRLGIQLKSRCQEEEAGRAYIFFGCRGYMAGICLGELYFQDGLLKWQGDLDAGNIQGKGIGLSDTLGVWVSRPKGRNYVAEWNDSPVDISRLIPYPSGGRKCIGCSRLGRCERSSI